MLRKNDKNKSGFQRVAKHGKKWRAWVGKDGKQIFLKPSQETPKEAAMQLYQYENAGKPTLRSPCPSHSCFRVFVFSRLQSPYLNYCSLDWSCRT